MVSAGPQLDTSRNAENSELAAAAVNPLSRNSAPSISREEALGKNGSEKISGKKTAQTENNASGGLLGWLEDKFHDAGKFLGEKLGQAAQVVKAIYDISPIGVAAKAVDWLAKGGWRDVLEVVKAVGKFVGNVLSSKEFWIGLALTVVSIAVPAVGLAMLAWTAVEAGAAIARGDYLTAGICIVSMIPGLRAARGTMSGIKEGFKAGVKEAAVLMAENQTKEAVKVFVQKAALSGGALSPVGKEAVAATSKQLGASADNFLAKNLSDAEIIKTVTTAGKNSADEATKILAQNQTQLAAQGVNSPVGKTVLSGIKEATAKETDKCIYDMLKKCGFQDHLEKEALKLLKLTRKGAKHLAKALEAEGFSKEEAKLLAKELRNTLSTPATDKAIKEMLTDKLTDKVVTHLKERQLKLANGQVKSINDVFQSSFDEGIDAFVKANPGKYSDDLILGVKNAGAEGFEEGLKRGVRRSISDALDSAFRKFRKNYPEWALDSEAKKRKPVLGHDVTIPVQKQGEFSPVHYETIGTRQEAEHGSTVERTNVSISGGLSSEQSDAGKLISIFVQHTHLNGVSSDTDYSGAFSSKKDQDIGVAIGKAASGTNESTKTVERILGTTTAKQVASKEASATSPKLELQNGGAATTITIKKAEAA